MRLFLFESAQLKHYKAGARSFRNLVRQEDIKLKIEMRRCKYYKRQHLPVRYVLMDKRWQLSYNRFRRWRP